MQLRNLQVKRIIIHQVFQRDSDGNRVDPLQTHELTNFDADALEEFKTRVISALGEDSRAVEMAIVRQASPNDLPNLVERISNADLQDFITSSYDFAIKLADAQSRRDIPGGILVVFFGTQGANNSKYVGIVSFPVKWTVQK